MSAQTKAAPPSGPKSQAARRSALQAEFREAVEAVQARDFKKAEPLLKQVAENTPKDYQPWFYLGYVYNETNRREEAIAAYRKAVELQPTDLESNANLGLLLAMQGEAEAARFLDSAGKLKPNPAQQQALSQAWWILANKLRTSNPAAAVDAYHKVAELRPKDPAPLLDLGQLLVQQKDLPGAEKAYRQALERDPNSADTLAVLSNLYLQTNRLPEAEQTLVAFLKANPTSANGHLQLGRVLRKQEKMDEAGKEFEKTLELQPGDVDAMKELASIQLGKKNYPAAEANLRNVIAKQPNDAELHFLLGNVLTRERKFSDAIPEYLAAIKLKPDWGEAYGELAVAASENKDYANAIRALNERAKYLQETPGTFFLRATCFDHLQAYKEASEQYKHFLDVADGRYPDQEWQARHRLIAIDPETRKKK